MSGINLGIDLGTTHSVAALVQDGQPIVLSDPEGRWLLPSVVGLDDHGQILVGWAALARAQTHPALTAAGFKRHMGTDTTIPLGSQSFRPEELSAMVLKTIVELAETSTGQKVAEAVVTVPAYFGEAQRRATRDAASIAGLHVERIINEPTAAALAYGLANLDREQRVAVLDLGGGTFDVSILEIIEGVVEIQSSAGDVRLGGDDFVDAIVEELRPELLAALGTTNISQLMEARLRAAAERSKKLLSRKHETNLVLNLEGAGHFRRTIARDEAETWWELLLARVKRPIRTALRDAQASPDDIEAVLLVGGATRMPAIHRLARELFGEVVMDELPPDEAVALGAAVQAALKARDKSIGDIVMTDIAPFSMGIQVLSQVGHRALDDVFAPILERGTVLPASRQKTFYTVQDRQTEVALRVYQGEAARTSKNTKLGEFFIRDLPIAQAGSYPIRVRFTYDLNGLLEIETRVPKPGRSKAVVVAENRGADPNEDDLRIEAFVIQTGPGVMSDNEIAESRANMERLKFHPRDSLPNVTAMARAEALHAELSGDARAMLQSAIIAFTLVLESEEQMKITESREKLIALTRHLSATGF